MKFTPGIVMKKLYQPIKGICVSFMFFIIEGILVQNLWIS